MDIAPLLQLDESPAEMQILWDAHLLIYFMNE
jgi:hypothetical protein